MFKRSDDSSETNLETDIFPPPPSKKQKPGDEDDEYEEEAEEINNNPVGTEEDGANDSSREAGAGSTVGDDSLVTEISNLGGDDMVTSEIVNLSADDMDRETGNLVQGDTGGGENAGNLGVIIWTEGQPTWM